MHSPNDNDSKWVLRVKSVFVFFTLAALPGRIDVCLKLFPSSCWGINYRKLIGVLGSDVHMFVCIRTYMAYGNNMDTVLRIRKISSESEWGNTWINSKNDNLRVFGNWYWLKFPASPHDHKENKLMGLLLAKNHYSCGSWAGVDVIIGITLGGERQENCLVVVSACNQNHASGE